MNVFYTKKTTTFGMKFDNKVKEYHYMVKNIFSSILIFSILIVLLSFTIDKDFKVYENIQFQNFSIHFDSLKLPILAETYKDSAIFEIGLGNEVENQTFQISSHETGFKIYQRFETSLAISNEGGHMDLLNWKHQKSDWIELKPKKENSYQTVKATENLKNRFPSFTNQELIKEIQSLSNNEKNCLYCLLAKNVTKATDYPAYIAVSKVELKIEYGLGNKIGTKYVILNLPMGC